MIAFEEIDLLSILLVENNTIFANVLTRLVNRAGNLQVTQFAETAESALQHLTEQKFDLALVDVSLPLMSGISFVALVHKAYPDLPCLMISGHMVQLYVKRSLEAGARGYVLKDNSAGILEGIQHVLDGEIYLSQELQDV